MSNTFNQALWCKACSEYHSDGHQVRPENKRIAYRVSGTKVHLVWAFTLMDTQTNQSIQFTFKHLSHCWADREWGKSGGYLEAIWFWIRLWVPVPWPRGFLRHDFWQYKLTVSNVHYKDTAEAIPEICLGKRSTVLSHSVLGVVFPGNAH